MCQDNVLQCNIHQDSLRDKKSLQFILYLITCARVLLRYRTGHTDCIYMPTHRLINTHEDLQKELAHKIMGTYVSVDLGSLMVLFSILV